MKLRTWLYVHKIKIAQFARLLGVSRCYLHQIFDGSKPSKNLLDKISELTHKNVAKFEDLKD